MILFRDTAIVGSKFCAPVSPVLRLLVLDGKIEREKKTLLGFNYNLTGFIKFIK